MTTGYILETLRRLSQLIAEVEGMKKSQINSKKFHLTKWSRLWEKGGCF